MEAAGHTWEESAWGSEVKFNRTGRKRTKAPPLTPLQTLAHEASVVLSLHWIALKLFDAAEAAQLSETISAADPTLGVIRWPPAEIRPPPTLSACLEGAARGKRGRIRPGRGGDCRGATSPPSSDRYRSRDGNRTQHPTEDASVIFPGSGRRLMKLPH